MSLKPSFSHWLDGNNPPEPHIKAETPGLLKQYLQRRDPESASFNRFESCHLVLLGKDAGMKVLGGFQTEEVGDLMEPVASSAAHNKAGSGFCVLRANRPEGGRRSARRTKGNTVSLGGMEPIEVRMGNSRPFF